MPLSHRGATPRLLASAINSPTWLAYALLLFVLAALFGPSLIGIDRLAFRDVGHFYTPLYRYIAAQERSQWLPLYNSLDIVGMPLAGETTTAVFYPPRRMVFFLAPSSETALAWYVVLHLVLAAAAIHYAAAAAGADAHGCALAVLAYPLSGPILFLYCNPPFLVGAAWVPVALAAGFRLLSGFHPRDVAVAAVGLAMPILGGDPQASIHVVLIGLAAATIGCLRDCRILRLRRAADKNIPPHPTLSPANLAARGGGEGATESAARLTKRGGGVSPLNSLAEGLWRIRLTASGASSAFLRLATVLLLAILLSSPQIAASVDWAKQSMRYAPANQLRSDDIYDFSVAPWHWLELAAPALWGQLFPVYTRISHLIPGDGRTWAITLYAGLIPLAFALLRLGCTRWRKLDLWDSLAPVGLAFALGSFGLGYLLKMLLPQATVGLSDATGGPYWFLATFLPGYSGFRYPAKWLIFVPLGIAIAAARQSSSWSPHRARLLRQACFALAVAAATLSAIVVIALRVAASESPQLLNVADPFWGPLQWQLAAQIVASSALAVTLLAAATFWVCRARLRRNQVTACLLVLSAVDLMLVAWPTLATIDRAAEAQRMAEANALAPASHRHVERQIALVHADATQRLTGPRAMRFAAGDGWLSQWRTLPSPGAERMLTVEASMRNSRYGRWNLMEDQAIFNPVTSLPPHRVRSFWQAANSLARQTPVMERTQYWDRVMGWLAIDQAWSVVAATDDDQEDRSTSRLLSLRIVPTRSASQRVVWSHSWRAVAQQRWVSPKTFAARLVEIATEAPHSPPMIEIAQTRDGHQHSIVANDAPPPDRAPPVEITTQQFTPSRWRITIDAPVDGLVCIKQFQDGNWRATLRELPAGSPVHAGAYAPTTINASRPTEVYRCDYLFSGVMVPAGTTEIILSYQPRWLWPSLILTGLAWLIALALALSRTVVWHRLRESITKRQYKRTQHSANKAHRT